MTSGEMPRSKSYELHPDARAEIEAAYLWYSQRNASVALDFLTIVEEALELVSQSRHGGRSISTAHAGIFLENSLFRLFIWTILIRQRSSP